MRRILLALLAVLTIAAALVATEAGAAPRAKAGIFCPYFQNPTVQFVVHTVCTR